MKKGTTFLFLCIVMLVCSCSPIKQKIRQCGRTGKTVIASNASSVYFYDDGGVYIWNVDSNKDRLLVDFKKAYSLKYFYIPLRPQCTKLDVELYQTFTNEGPDIPCESFRVEDANGNILTYDSLINVTSNCQFMAVKDGIVVKLESGQYLLFLLRWPNICVSMPKMATYFSSDQEYVAEDIEVTYEGSLWEYDDDPFDGGYQYPSFPNDIIEDELLFYWWMNMDRLPMDIFDFSTTLTIHYDGSIKIGDSFSFSKLSCDFSARDMINGNVFRSICPLMNNLAVKQVEQDLMGQCVSFDSLVDEFEGNPIRAKEYFPENEEIVLYAKLERIRKSDHVSYKYVLTYSDFSDNYLRVYTNDENFVGLSYPCRVYIRGVFKGREIDYGFFSTDKIFYNVENAFLLETE